VGVIDPYFACQDYLLYDVAIALNSWCMDSQGRLNHSLEQAFLHGYLNVHPDLEREFIHLPVLCRAAALRFLLTRLEAWQAKDNKSLITPKNPKEYLDKLQTWQQQTT
jgi:homoserine kinase type II